MYDNLAGHLGCDEASLMSFFALLQHSPEGRVHAERISRATMDGDKRNPSAYLADGVEDAVEN